MELTKDKQDATLQTFLADLHLVSPLQPRDTFLVGITNAATIHYVDPTVGEQIRYVDVNSLFNTQTSFMRIELVGIPACILCLSQLAC